MGSRGSCEAATKAATRSSVWRATSTSRSRMKRSSSGHANVSQRAQGLGQRSRCGASSSASRPASGGYRWRCTHSDAIERSQERRQHPADRVDGPGGERHGHGNGLTRCGIGHGDGSTGGVDAPRGLSQWPLIDLVHIGVGERLQRLRPDRAHPPALSGRPRPRRPSRSAPCSSRAGCSGRPGRARGRRSRCPGTAPAGSSRRRARPAPSGSRTASLSWR